MACSLRGSWSVNGKDSAKLTNMEILTFQISKFVTKYPASATHFSVQHKTYFDIILETVSNCVIRNQLA